jgi:WD40-like Beta Propeller Repeat
MKSTFTYLLIFFFCLQISAQKKFLSSLKDQKTFDLAQDLYDEGKFEFALKQFKKLEATSPSEPILLYRIGVCQLYEKGNRQIAYDYLSKVDKSKFSKSDFLYRLAQAQLIAGKYDEATTNATEALTKKLEPKKLEDVRLLIKQIENAKNNLSKNNPAHTVSNLGSMVNSKFDESNPAINASGNYLLFSYTGEKSVGGLQAQPGDKNTDGIYYSDIFLSKKGNDGNWSSSKLYDSLMAANGSEYPLSIAADGMRMLSGRQESYVNHSVSMNKKDSAGAWALIGEVMGLVNSPSYEGGAALFPSNNKMVFSSDRLGGFGGKDLYIAELMEDSTWGRIKNLGQGINGPNDEDFPHMHVDGKTLHFSSNGPSSMGGYDIFVAEYSPEEDTWGSKTNLGAPINTAHDELQFQLVSSGKSGYFSSGRNGGQGGSDIYMVSGLSYKSDPAYEKKEAEMLAMRQKATTDSLAMVKSKEIEAQQAALSKNTASTNNEITTKQLANSEAKQLAVEKANADKAAKMEAKQAAIDKANADKEARRIEKIAREEATKLAKEEAIAAKQANASTNITNNSWDWSKYDLSSESSIAAEFGEIKTENVVYKVQIASGTLPESINNAINSELGQIEELKVKGGKKYVIEKAYTTINEAFQLKNKAIEKGIGDAFITGFYNGKRFYLIDLVKKGILRK